MLLLKHMKLLLCPGGKNSNVVFIAMNKGIKYIPVNIHQLQPSQSVHYQDIWLVHLGQLS